MYVVDTLGNVSVKDVSDTSEVKYVVTMEGNLTLNEGKLN